MERVIIFKNTDTGQALILPVTPSSYPMEAGRAVERLDMAQTGQIALPGLNTLFAGTLEFMLPARSYPFLTAGAIAQPSHYIGLLTAWSAAANVCRYIVTGTDINAPVLLGPLDYGEADGTNDVNCKLPLYEYRYLDEAKAEKVTQNNGRPVDTTSQPETAGSYTVVKGDSLWAICKKFYGDGSLAYKLDTANITQLCRSITWSGDWRSAARTLRYAPVASAADIHLPRAPTELGGSVQFWPCSWTPMPWSAPETAWAIP